MSGNRGLFLRFHPKSAVAAGLQSGAQIEPKQNATNAGTDFEFTQFVLYRRSKRSEPL